jgi:putative spermidine/putrescine transport system substrate-binding protein
MLSIFRKPGKNLIGNLKAEITISPLALPLALGQEALEMGMGAKLKITAIAMALATATVATAHADTMVFTAWGGSTQDAQYESWGAPLSAATGATIVMDGPTDYGKFQAMVEAGSVTWDAVDVEFDFAYQAAKVGLLEPLDFSVIDRAAIDPRFVTDHAVISFPFSFVLAYNLDTYGDAKPAGWSDLFDTSGFPGKRAFYKWSSPGALEIALLADGVAPEDLYPLDLDRAFAKLDTIKDQIVWWGGGAQSQQLIASGEAPIGMFWDLRLFPLQASGLPVEIQWNGSLASADALVVPKGSPNKDLAMQFIAKAASAEGQKAFMEMITAEAVEGGVAGSGAVQTRPEGGANQISLDLAWWGENRDMVAKRWYDWQAQ